MKTFYLLCLILVLVMGGCITTLQDAKNSPPTFTIQSKLPAKILANKIAYESTQESASSLFPYWDPVKVIEIDNGVQKLLVTMSRPPSPAIPVAEITIVPKDDGSFLEYHGRNWYKEDKFLDMIRHCAAP